MAAGDPVNLTYVDYTHPCYEIDLVFLTQINTSSSECVLLHIFLSFLSTVIVCGNLLVLISIIYFRQLHTPTNFLILSLAVSDLLVGVLLFPLSTKFPVSLCMQSPDVFCRVQLAFDLILSTASILNLCCISIDRYYAVCQPLIYRTKINTNVVVIMITFTWSTAVVTTIVIFIAKLNFDRCKKNCCFCIVVVNFLGQAVSYYLPMVMMVCIYLKILKVAQKQASSIQNTNSQSTKCETAAVKKREGKATRTLAIVMGAFLVCWLPLFFCYKIKLLSSVSLPVAAFETLVWIGLSNSLLNPFIYAFFYTWFRSAFRLILSGKILHSDFSNSKLL